MSEQVPENPHQAAQPGAETAQEPTDTPVAQQQAAPATPSDGEQTFDLRLVKRDLGLTHWDVAKGRWEPVTHAETGEPDSVYTLVATIDGVDVPLTSWNAGRVETVVRSQQQAPQQTEG